MYIFRNVSEASKYSGMLAVGLLLNNCHIRLYTSFSPLTAFSQVGLASSYQNRPDMIISLEELRIL